MVPFLDLKAQYQTIAAEVEPKLLEVIRSGGYILGPNVEAFEAEFGEFLGIEHVVGVSSGLDALRMSLLACDVGPGDEVIIPASTFIATSLAVSGVGAVPVLVDPDPQTSNLTLEGVRAALTDRTRVIMPVHLYGHATAMASILELAEERGIKVIEDACQAHGALIDGRSAGTIGHLGCFSFYPGKNLGAMGDAGAVVTSSPDLAARLRRLSNYGQERKYVHIEKGFNHRMDAIQATALRVKLKHLADWNLARQRHAATYDRLLADLPVETPTVLPGHTHVYHLYVIRTQRRDELQKHLDEAGIGTIIHYPVPIHLQLAYRDLESPEGSFPITEERSKTMLSLPMFAELTDEQIHQVVDGIRRFFS